MVVFIVVLMSDGMLFWQWCLCFVFCGTVYGAGEGDGAYLGACVGCGACGVGGGDACVLLEVMVVLGDERQVGFA